LSFEIRQNEFVGIIGESGSGKSTVFDLMLGLLTPQKGIITIGGLNPQIIHKTQNPRISLVSQRTGIFNATVRMNLTVDPNINFELNDEKIWSALSFAGLHDFVKSLPHALDTNLGELGSKFSGGQRQRLGIARAILQEPNILLLDEATSSLDAESEYAISRVLENLRNQITILTIAHRLSFVKTADKILYLKNGKLISQGTFEELFENNASFRNQVNLLGLA
jgi:ATP-binding cassette subfamily C protein